MKRVSSLFVISILTAALSGTAMAAIGTSNDEFIQREKAMQEQSGYHGSVPESTISKMPAADPVAPEGFVQREGEMQSMSGYHGASTSLTPTDTMSRTQSTGEGFIQREQQMQTLSGYHGGSR